MFWFLVALVVIIILAINSSTYRTKERDAYWRGRNDEWLSVRTLIDRCQEEGQPIEELRRRFLQAVGQADPQQPAAPTSPSTSTPESTTVVAAATATSIPAVSAPAQPPLPPTVQPTIPVRELSVEEKEKRTVKNLNILLYVGSFLIVSATALFVTLTMPPLVRLLSMIFITLVFYISGLLLHQMSVRLRSAGVAFAGTGLAIVPFIGLALTSQGGLSAEMSWLITSVVGVAAFTIAAVRLQSQLISYITIAFMVSLALSVVPVAELSVAWYFIAVLIVSILANLLHLLWPKKIPPVFARPLRDSSAIMTPLTLVASLSAIGAMGAGAYEIIFSLATLHYLVLWGISRTAVHEVATRVLAHTTLLLVGADMLGLFANGYLNKFTPAVNPAVKTASFGLLWLFLGAIQGVYSLLRADKRHGQSLFREQSIFALSLGLMIFANVFFIGNANWQLWVSIGLTVAAVACFSAAFRWRQVDWLYGTLVAALFLPFLIGRGVIEPRLSFQVIALVFAVASAGFVAVLERAVSASRSLRVQNFCLVAAIAFAIMTAISGVLTLDNVGIGWTMMVASVLFIVTSFIARAAWLEAVGVLLGVISIAGWSDRLVSADQWQHTATMITSVGAVVLASTAHYRYNQANRGDMLAVIAAVLIALLTINLHGDIVVARTAIALLSAIGVGALVLRAVANRLSRVLGAVALTGYILYPILALLMAAMISEPGWLSLTLLVITGVAWASSYIEAGPGVMAAGHIGLFFLIIQSWSWLNFSSDWAIYGIGWISAMVYYLWYWFSFGRVDKPRQDISLAAALLVLALPILHGIFAVSGNIWAIASATSMIVAAIMLAVNGQLSRQLWQIEISVYVAILGLSRIVATLLPDLNPMVYIHWWAAVIILMSLWRKEYVIRVATALAMITLPMSLYALSQGGMYAMVFLVEHIVIAVTGALLRRQWVMWWGVISSLMAVLYFLRDYTVFLLLFLGVLLILFVVWRLLKGGQSKPSE